MSAARVVSEYENFSHGVPPSALPWLERAPEEVKQEISDRIDREGRLKIGEIKAIKAKIRQALDQASKEVERIIETDPVKPSDQACLHAYRLLRERYEDDRAGFEELVWGDDPWWLSNLLEEEPPDEEASDRLREHFRQLAAERRAGPSKADAGSRSHCRDRGSKEQSPEQSPLPHQAAGDC
jgi:hypothetical protein